jgi:capsular polysaccharide biosynthesis protein
MILAAAVCGAALWGYASFMIKPVYQARASIYVYSDTVRLEGIVTGQELSASQQLAETCKVIILSDLVLDAVEEKLESQRTVSQMRGNISVSSANGTEILNIYVKDTNPKMAKKVANTLLTVLPKEMVRIVKAGDVEVIDHAKTPTVPIAPNVTNHTAAGILFGLLFSSSLTCIT